MEISKLKELSLFESIMLFEEQLKSKNNIKFYERYKGYKITKDNENYALVNLETWDVKSKEILLKSAMVGIHHFYFNLTNKRSLNIGGFNSVINVINGSDKMNVYVNSIKWFPNEIKEKIIEQGINYLEIESYNTAKRKRIQQSESDRYNHRNWLPDASGTNDPETMNDVYWNLD